MNKITIQYSVTYIGEVEVDETASSEEILACISEDQHYWDNPNDIEWGIRRLPHKTRNLSWHVCQQIILSHIMFFNIISMMEHTERHPENNIGQ